MLRLALLPLLLSLTLRASPASAQTWSLPAQEPRPRSGIGALAVSGGAFSFALFNLATVPICFADFYTDLYPGSGSTPCVVVSGVLAAGGLAVAIPSLTLGLRRHAHYREWKSRQRRLRALAGFRLDFARERAWLGFATRF